MHKAKPMQTNHGRVCYSIFYAPTGLDLVGFHYTTHWFAPALFSLLNVGHFFLLCCLVTHILILSPSFLQMLPGQSSCWRSCRSQVMSPVTSSSLWRRSFRASSAQPSERWVAFKGENRWAVNTEMNLVFPFLSLCETFFVFKCFAWPFLCRQSSLWLFCNTLPINHCAELAMFFFLGDVVCEVAALSESASEILYWSPGHICCFSSQDPILFLLTQNRFKHFCKEIV